MKTHSNDRGPQAETVPLHPGWSGRRGAARALVARAARALGSLSDAGAGLVEPLLLEVEEFRPRRGPGTTEVWGEDEAAPAAQLPASRATPGKAAGGRRER